MKDPNSVNHTFADHGTYLHRRDTLHQTEREYKDQEKQEQRRDLIVKELLPFFERKTSLPTFKLTS